MEVTFITVTDGEPSRSGTFSLVKTSQNICNVHINGETGPALIAGKFMTAKNLSLFNYMITTTRTFPRGPPNI